MFYLPKDRMKVLDRIFLRLVLARNVKITMPLPRMANALISDKTTTKMVSVASLKFSFMMSLFTGGQSDNWERVDESRSCLWKKSNQQERPLGVLRVNSVL